MKGVDVIKSVIGALGNINSHLLAWLKKIAANVKKTYKNQHCIALEHFKAT